MVFCTRCGAQMGEEDRFCEKCGTPNQEVNSQNPTMILSKSLINQKSMTIVTLLAVIPGLLGFWGLGHFYAGKILRGTVFLIIGLCLVFLNASFIALSGLLSGPLIALIPAIALFDLDFLANSLVVLIALIVIQALVVGAGYLWQAVDAIRAVQKWNNIVSEKEEKSW